MIVNKSQFKLLAMNEAKHSRRPMITVHDAVMVPFFSSLLLITCLLFGDICRSIPWY
jgi:hypothetical protein